MSSVAAVLPRKLAGVLSFVLVEIPVTNRVALIATCALFCPYGGHSVSELVNQVLECVCCLAANLSCTKLPWSASVGAWTTLIPVTRHPVLPSFAPITGAEDLASGLVSNAFRRNAARCFGMYATPAPFFTISGRGCSTLRLGVKFFACSLPSSRSAPAVSCARPLAWMPHSARVALQVHRSCNVSNGCIVRFSLFGSQWALDSSQVWLQPLKSIPKAYATRTAFLKFRILSCHLVLKLPFSALWKRFPRHFLRSLP